MTETIPTSGWVHGWDAVDVPKMPADGVHYLYVDGNYAADTAAHQLYPDALTIAIESSTEADEFDFEPGNPDDIVTWIINMRALGRDPVVYASDGTEVDEVLFRCTNAGIHPPKFRLAKWTPTEPATVPVYGAGTVAVQDADLGDYDRNLISPDHPALQRRQTPPTPPLESELKNHVTIFRIIDHEEVYGVLWPAGKSWHIEDTTALEAYIKLGVEQVTVPLAEYQALTAAI